MADSGSTVRLRTGQVLQVELTGARWQGPQTRDGLYLIDYSERENTTTAQLQALRASSQPVRLTAQTDDACRHDDPACTVPTRTWTLDVVIEQGDAADGRYPCYANPSSSPAPGTVELTQADSGSRKQVEQGAFVSVSLNGCNDPYTVPSATGPLFRSTSGYRANGSNRTFFQSVSIELYAYSRPSTTYRLVHSGFADKDGTASFRIRPPTNTRLYAKSRFCPAGPSVVLNVATALTLTAERLGTRTYRFAGDSLPARPGGLIVSLYRVDGDRRVLTAQARANSTDGEWSLVRHFTGAGRFGFFVRTGQDLTNAPGRSNVRSTLIF